MQKHKYQTNYKPQTTVVRGWVEVPYNGHYEFRAGEGDSAYNITEVNGKESYRFEPGMQEARITPIALSTGTRHAFRTTFLKQPGHAFTVPMIDKPGALETVVRNNPAYAFLRNRDGSWASRDDFILFDAQPIPIPPAANPKIRAATMPLRLKSWKQTAYASTISIRNPFAKATPKDRMSTAQAIWHPKPSKP
ncbi:MAG: hypothetical protein ACNA71_06600 [Kiritimatiellia bacterium]